MTGAETISALSTVPGRSGVAVVRVSGANAFNVATAMCGSLGRPREMVLRTLREPRSGEVLDQAMVVCFSDGNSFTGEDVVEFHLHGSKAVVTSVLDAIFAIGGTRPAEAGEFTRRALSNQKMDLAQVEGLGDLLMAETKEQQKQSLIVYQGDLSRKVEEWRSLFLRARALIEATIDFVEEDVPVDVKPEVWAICGRLLEELGAELAGFAAARSIRDGMEVAIIGKPNIGKSTLVNAIAGRQMALTSDEEGTTRDVLEVRVDLEGLAVTFLDTAGLRNATNRVEKLGIDLAQTRAREADLRIFLIDSQADLDDIEVTLEQDDLVVTGKADLGSDVAGLKISGVTGEGLPELLKLVGDRLSERVAGASSIVRVRHKTALRDACLQLQYCVDFLDSDREELEVLAEYLRSGASLMDSVIGRVGVEAILGEIFSSFCIGK